jgi:diguanylate cyclase (GGDEF)-like protein
MPSVPVPHDDPADQRRQAHFAVQSRLALLLYTGFAGIGLGGAFAGLLPWRHAGLLAGLSVGGGLLGYAVVRSGLNRRLADPSCTLPQCVWGLLCTCAAYVLHPSARGAMLTLLMITLAFGMFSLTPRQSRRFTLLAVALLAGATAWPAWRDPTAFPAALQATHFAAGALSVWGMSVLSSRMAGLRSHLREQKAELRQALAQIQRLATQDELTGLHNRRHMREVLTSAQREGRTMSLALIDIDRFKRINDDHGHAVGDRVLAAFAVAARQAVREGDVLARWGGEEFLMMLPATAPEAAEQVLQRLRERVAALPLADVLDGRCLTFSAGLVACGPGETLDTAIERADRLMYQAKQAGRDRLAVARAAATA